MSDDTGSNGGKGDLTTIAAAATAAIGIVASLSVAGIIQRVLRNHGEILGGSLCIVLIAAIVWLWATLGQEAEGDRKRRHNRLKLVAAGLFVLGVIGSVIATIATARDVERPSISASYDRASSSVKAHVTAGNISSSDSIAVNVDALTAQKDGTWAIAKNLSRDFVGPDGDGDVSTDLQVMVPVGRYDAVGVQAWNVKNEKDSVCTPDDATVKSQQNLAKKKGRACVVLPLPRHRARPALTTSWTSKGDMLTVEASAADLKFRVLVVRVAAGSKLLGYQLAGPGTDGAAKANLQVPVPSGAKAVCVEARVFPRVPRTQPMTCPLAPTTLAELHDKVAAVQLRVPAAD
jgi:hypothetical protein